MILKEREVKLMERRKETEAKIKKRKAAGKDACSNRSTGAEAMLSRELTAVVEGNDACDDRAHPDPAVRCPRLGPVRADARAGEAHGARRVF